MTPSRAELITWITLSTELLIYAALIIFCSIKVATNDHGNDYYCQDKRNATLIHVYPKKFGYENFYDLDDIFVMDKISFSKGVLYSEMPAHDGTTQLYISCNGYIDDYLILSQKIIVNEKSKYKLSVRRLILTTIIGLLIMIFTCILLMVMYNYVDEKTENIIN